MFLAITRYQLIFFNDNGGSFENLEMSMVQSQKDAIGPSAGRLIGT